jgi:hypothetical protein
MCSGLDFEGCGGELNYTQQSVRACVRRVRQQKEGEEEEAKEMGHLQNDIGEILVEEAAGELKGGQAARVLQRQLPQHRIRYHRPPHHELRVSVPLR